MTKQLTGQQEIIIVGAGIAGLVTARELSPHAAVTILEALPRTGGRIYSEIIEGVLVERGAEFVHGELPATNKLLREAGLHTTVVSGRMYQLAATGKLVAERDENPLWEEMLQKMEDISEDCTLSAFFDRYFDGPAYRSLRDEAFAFAGGFDLADPDRVSVKSLVREWSLPPEDNYRVNEGYGSLVKYLTDKLLAEGVRICCGDPVTAIEERGPIAKTGPVVQTASGKTYTASRVVVTIPAGVLQRGSVRVSPAIDHRLGLIRGIGTGPVLRFSFGFRQKLWPPDTMFLFSDAMVPTWWPASSGNYQQLVGWAGAAKALALHPLDSEAQLAAALESLAQILALPVETLEKNRVFAIVTDWTDNPWSAGGYSYATPGSEKAKAALNQDHSGLTWFAGESYSDTPHPGTVEAAILHAQQVAAMIRTALHA